MKLQKNNTWCLRKSVAGLMLAGSLLLLLAAPGCGSSGQSQNAVADSGQTTATTASATTTTNTAPAVATTSTIAADCPPANAGPQQPQTPQPVIVSYSINKAVANYGDMITFSADIQGDAASVRVIFGAAGGDISTPHSISVMTETSSSGGVTTWTTSAPAPHGAKFPPPDTGKSFYMIEVVSQDNTLIRSADNQHNYVVNG